MILQIIFHILLHNQKLGRLPATITNPFNRLFELPITHFHFIQKYYQTIEYGGLLGYKYFLLLLTSDMS